MRSRVTPGRCFGAFLNAVCTYESVALNTNGRFLPPLTRPLLWLHWAPRAVLVGGFGVALFDHLFTRRCL